MNILLLSPENDVWALGLRSISAVLKVVGYHTRLVFLTTNNNGFSKDTLEEIASLSHETDLVGVSCLALGLDKAKQVIQYLRSINKFIVWGGIHASLNPRECAKYADIVCRGEGEGMMLELAQRLEQGRDWKDIQNIAYNAEGVYCENPLRPPIGNLDDLPLPDFTFEDEYHLKKKGLIKVSTLPDVKKSGMVLFNSSRGCAYHCTYCCNAKLKNLYMGKDRYIRRMSIPKLIEHSQSLKKIFPKAKYIYYIDEDFAARPVKELAQLAEQLPLKVGLPFSCLAHPGRITEEKMDLLIKAGMFRIHIGIESGSERTKKEIYDRHVSNEVTIRAASIIKKYRQVTPLYFIIYSNPYEERQDLVETLKLLSSLPSGCYVQTYNLVFFPGSHLYERAVSDQLIQGEHDSGYEINILWGYNYETHSWKRKNIYLNGLIYLTDGLFTRYSIGSLPRFAMNALLCPVMIDLNSKFPLIIKSFIYIKHASRAIRFTTFKLIKKIIGNPIALYKLKNNLLAKVTN